MREVGKAMGLTADMHSMRFPKAVWGYGREGLRLDYVKRSRPRSRAIRLVLEDHAAWPRN